MKKLKQIFNILFKSADVPQLYRPQTDETYLIDVQRGSYASTGWVNEATDSGSTPGGEGHGQKTKLFVKPIDILNEIKEAPKLVSLVGLDGKIEILKLKKGLVLQSYAVADITTLIQLLQNRKKYKGSVATFFRQFDTTTKDKIDAVLSKYELVMKSADIFVPEFPDEAVIIMKKYSDAVFKVCKKKPIFYVIATSDNFKEKADKRDPILVATSPFGTYYDILGAWDKEMLLLSEL